MFKLKTLPPKIILGKVSQIILGFFFWYLGITCRTYFLFCGKEILFIWKTSVRSQMFFKISNRNLAAAQDTRSQDTRKKIDRSLSF